MLRISLQRFAQHDRGEDSQAMTWRSNLKRRLNSSADLRVLLLLFVVTAIVFSAFPLLRHFRGRTLFDYKLWYETGQHVLAGHEIYSFRSGKYDFMYPPPCLVFQRAVECSSRWLSNWGEKCVAVCDSKSAGDRIHLVQLSSRPAEPGFARADARRFCGIARRSRDSRRWPDCHCRGDQGISNSCDNLSALPPLLDRGSKSRRNTGVFDSHRAGAIPRIRAGLSRHPEMERWNVDLQRSQGGAAPDAQLHMEKSISHRRQ